MDGSIAGKGVVNVSVNRGDNRPMCCLDKESRGFKGQHGGKGVVVPLLTTDNIEKTHPWTSCDIWKYTDTGDRETDRGRNTQDQHLQRQA